MALLDHVWSISDYITPFQAALITTLLLLYSVYLFLRNRTLPPGPKGLPYIGYFPFLNSKTSHVRLQEMVKKYGDLYSFRSFGRLYVHLGSMKAIKEVHITKGDCFAGRYTDYNILLELSREGVLMVNGEKWKALRKFFLQRFKEYGMSGVKERNFNAIQDALDDAVEELHKSQGQPIAVTDLTTNKCLSIIRTILFNDQGISENEMQELRDLYNSVIHEMKSTDFFLFGNLARYIVFPFSPRFWRMKRSQDRVDSILMNVVERHKKNYDGLQIVDVVDSFLKEREDRKRKGDPTAEYFTDKALVSSITQFVTDGVLTVGLFIGIFLLRLVEFPEEQQKIYEELMDVVGPERLPTTEDKTKLPYTNAFIYEVMRLSDFFPFFPTLQCSKETEIQGQRVPKGAIMLVNFYAAHRDPNNYEDPETFNPSRYLSSSKTKADLPVLFGVGKRSCIGEAFTMTQTFLFVSTIVKIFRLAVPESQKGASITFWNPEKVKICAIPRSQK